MSSLLCRHCEERSDEANQRLDYLDCFVPRNDEHVVLFLT
jgi:hypothetical protein